MPQITCPTCGALLTVNSTAPLLVTCPRCLHAISTGSAPSIAAEGRPIPVIPLEQEIRRDRTASGVSVFLVIAALAIGCGAAYQWSEGTRIQTFLITVGVVVGCLLTAAALFSWRPHPR